MASPAQSNSQGSGSEGGHPDAASAPASNAELFGAFVAKAKPPMSAELRSITTEAKFVVPDGFSHIEDRCILAMAQKALVDAHREAYDKIHEIIGDRHALELHFFQLHESLETSIASPEQRAEAYDDELGRVWEFFGRTDEGRIFLSNDGQDLRSYGHEMKEIDRLYGVLKREGAIPFLDAVASGICAIRFHANTGHDQPPPTQAANYRKRLFDPEEAKPGAVELSSGVLMAFMVLSTDPTKVLDEAAAKEPRHLDFNRFVEAETPEALAKAFGITEQFEGKFAKKNLLKAALMHCLRDAAQRGKDFPSHPKHEALFEMLEHHHYLEQRLIITTKNDALAYYIAETVKARFPAEGLGPLVAVGKSMMTGSERKKGLSNFRAEKGDLLVVSNLAAEKVEELESLGADCIMVCEPFRGRGEIAQTVRHLSQIQDIQIEAGTAASPARLPFREQLGLKNLVVFVTLHTSEGVDYFNSFRLR
ncbi:hypothetical protein OAO01_04765, partial [Oligoflexia bacterium]|nr:hypothetical protein [Oligoflexia bacterium]